MTERLYYTDPALTSFEATIVVVREKSDAIEVLLDRSAFYPTSGGQLADRGHLNEIEVADVREADDGSVVHVVSQVPGKVGDRVAGQVDVARRTRHRQQHTAQHILSQALIRLFDAETVSVHLGEAYGAVELPIESLNDQQLAQAETEANRVVQANLPVTIHLVSPEEARALPLRRVPERQGFIRIIQIGELDYSACGGTHCHSTAEVGLVKILSATKQRGNLLVTVLAGVQAVADYRARFAVSEQLARDLTCHYSDLPDKLDKLIAEHKAQRRQIRALQKELLPVRASQLAEEAERVGQHPFVGAAVSDLEPKTAGALAQQIVQMTGGIVLFQVENRLLVATADGHSPNAKEIVAALCEATGLRGGGSPAAAQIGGAEPGEFEHYRRLVKDMLAGA